jgi:hypothetical protein
LLPSGFESRSYADRRARRGREHLVF